jgi:dienelactone hydrolase
VIYVCGHGQVKMDGVAYGNKVYYQHHPTWFARHGYACLALDTIQLGELEGIHHGTYRENMWWWNARGYTPAGVEAWNGIRAIDYLQSLKEIDPDKIGITGRSGGGAYSWWIAALDERIKAAAPVAGITDLQNHVVDGVIEGHCDCMFHVNTYRWDFDQVAALIAPRPLLILNTDSDPIFPLDGVYRLFTRTRKLYESLGHPDHIGLVITPGGHKDTQELQLPAFKWMNLHLKGVEEDISPISERPFSPQQLQVFSEGPPANQRTTTIHESFSLPRMQSAPPHSTADLQNRLREKCFAGWPESPPDLQPKMAFDAVARGIRFQGFDFSPQPGIELRIYSLQSASLDQAT